MPSTTRPVADIACARWKRSSSKATMGGSGTAAQYGEGNRVVRRGTPRLALPRDPENVEAVRADPPGGPRGRRGAEPPPARACRLHPSGRPRHLLLAAAGAARLQ